MALWATAPASGEAQGGEVNGFIEHRGPALQCSSLHVLAAAMRSFLSFLHFTGRTPATLASGVVCPAPRPRNPIPNTLSDPELRRFLKGFDRTQAIGKRDFAMALCLCRLGLRAKEVTSLQLEDVDWAGSNFASARDQDSKKPADATSPRCGRRHPGLSGTGRPATDCSRIFVQHRAPYGAADRRSGFLRAAVRCACLRAGLNQRGVHILRHTVATRLYRRGVPLKTIADLLGHLSINTTARYARVHLQELREAALPWPR